MPSSRTSETAVDSPPKKATEGEMVELLRKRYCQDSGNGPTAVLIPQVRNAAGFDAIRTADALVMQLWPSRGLHLEGFEVKCSRADVLKELKQPEKAEVIARYCERWWLVISDAKLLKDGELPGGWGLLVRHGGRLVCQREAPVRDVPKELPKTFLAALLRSADRESLRPTEEQLRAKYDEGVAAGESNSRYKLKSYEELQERVRKFEELSGVKIENGYNLEAHAATVRMVTGNGWDSIAHRLDSIGSEAAKLSADIKGAGLTDE